MTVEAHAKINWTLQVLDLRKDGYRNLRSIVLPIPLHDTVVLEESDSISCSMPGTDVPENANLAYRAAALLQKSSGAKSGAKITITKRIPSGAGFGGGSADAAATLNALNGMWGLGYTLQDLCAIGAEIGSDIPSLLYGCPVLMEGRGEIVRRLSADETALLPPADSIFTETPGVFSSTAAVYREFRDSDRGLGHNDLQPAAERLHPEIAVLAEDMRRRGFRRVTMTGSGSAVFGLYPANARRSPKP